MTTTKAEPAQNNNKNGLVKEINGNAPIKEKMKLEPPTATVVVPPDGGWGWVVMVASFFCNVIVDGMVMNFSNFKQPIRDEFNISETQVTIVHSLLSGFYLIAGPFASALANRWGFRLITVIGSFTAAIAVSLSYFATGIIYLYIVYGVIGGICLCLVYIPSVIAVGYYFERWRALATGIALCGSGVGTFVFSPLNSFLIDKLEWRGALLVHAAIILICAVCGMMYLPLKPVQVSIEQDDDEPDEKETHLPIIFTRPLPEGRFAYSSPNSVHNTWMGASNNYQYPTAAEVFKNSGAYLERRPSGNAAQLNQAMFHKTTSKKLEQLSKAQRRSSGSSTPEDVLPAPQFNKHKELNTVGEDEEENETLIDDEVKPTMFRTRRHTVSGRRPNLPSRSNKKHMIDNRPMYRDDIFFSGSLVRIPQYQSQSSLGYHMSVTRLPTMNDVDEEDGPTCKLCPEAVRRTLATMLDMSLLKSPSFMLLALSGFLTMMGFFVPFLFLEARATSQNMAKESASMLVSTIGASNTVARIICGVLSTLKGVNALHINNIALTFGGFATIFSGLYYTPAYQFTYSAIFGITIACFSALRSIIAVDLMGLEKLTNAFGILMLGQGLAAIMGTPIAGSLYEATKDYNFSFYFAGILITLSAFLCYPLNMVNNWEKNRAAAADDVFTKKKNVV